MYTNFMGQVTAFTDKKTDISYTISTVENNKKVFIKQRAFDSIYETALLKGKFPRTNSRKPICIFELIELPTGISLEEFHNQICDIIKAYSVKELLSSTSIYFTHGFYSYVHQSFQFFALTKINIIYLVPKDSIMALLFTQAIGDRSVTANALDEIEKVRASKQSSSQTIYEDGDLTKALALKYEEIIGAEINNYTEDFKQYLSELSKSESKEICLVGYNIRKAEAQLTGKSISRISPEIAKILNSKNNKISKPEEIANYLNENNEAVLGNRVANYTLLPIQEVKNVLEGLVEELLEQMAPADPSSAAEVFFLLINFGYLFCLAEEIVKNSALLNTDTIDDEKIAPAGESSGVGPEFIANNGKHYSVGFATAKDVEHDVGF